MRREDLKRELKEVMLWGGAEETPEYWAKEVEEEGYSAVLKRIKERVSEWRAVNQYEEDIVEEAKTIAEMEWREVENLIEEVFDEILKEAEET